MSVGVENYSADLTGIQSVIHVESTSIGEPPSVFTLQFHSNRYARVRCVDAVAFDVDLRAFPSFQRGGLRLSLPA
jgi:G3E family GTPase